MSIKFSARGISSTFRTPQELVEQDAVTLKPTVGGEVIVSGVGDTIALASDYTEEGGCTVGENSYPDTKTLNDAGISVISDVFGAYDCDAEEGLNVKMVDRWAKPTFIPEFTLARYGHGKISTVEANVPYEVFKNPSTTPTAFTPDPNVAYINVSIMGNQYKFNAHTYQKDGKLWIVFETGYPIPAPYARTITFALFPKGAKEKIIMKSDNKMLCHGAYYDGCYAMMTNGAATGFSWNTEEELVAMGYHAVDPIPIPEEV